MSRNTQYARLVVIALSGLFAFVATARADTWLLPERKAVLSPNGEYRLEIIPKQLESQLSYWGDKVEGKDNAGASEGVPKNWARGVFAVRGKDGQYEQLSEFQLLNEVAPVSALISDDGRYIVTFDDWHMRGYGDTVVVIYRTDGTVINSLALRDFLTVEDIYELPHSISSIQWSGTHLLDHSKGLLILRVVGCRRTVSSCDRFFEVPIRLETGLAIEPKTNHLPQPRVFLSTDPSPMPEHTKRSHSQPFCNPGQQYPAHAEVAVLSTTELLARIVDAPLPSYSKTARALNVQGSIVLEVVVLSSGEVGCVRILRGLPLGIGDDLRSTVLGWRFDPTQPDERSASFVGCLTVEYRWVEKDHPAYSDPQPPIDYDQTDRVFIR